MKLKFSIIIFVFIILFFSSKKYKAKGETFGYQFLEIAPFSRGMSLSSALSVGSKGAESLYYNPAGLYFSKNKEFIFSYNKWILNTQYGSLFFSKQVKNKTGKKYGWGVGIIYMDEGVIESGYGVNDLSVIGGIGVKFKKYILLGVSAQYIHRTIFDASGDAFSVSLGIKFKFYSFLKSIVWGITLKNFGFSSKIISNNDKLPEQINIGCVYPIKLKVIDMKIKTFFNVKHYFNSKTEGSIGLEFIKSNILYLRFGRNIEVSDSVSLYAGEKKFIMGGGIQFPLQNLLYKIDFSVLPFRELGTSYNITFSIIFK